MDKIIAVIVTVIIAGAVISKQKPEWIDTIKGWLGL